MKRLFFVLALSFAAFALLPGFASAETPPAGGVTYYQLSALTDVWGVNDAVATGTTNSANYPVFNISGSGSPNSSEFAGDGTNRINTTYNPNTEQDFSFSMWIYSDVAYNSEPFRFISDDANTGKYLQIGSVDSTTKFGLEIRNDGASLFRATEDINNLSASTWYHIVITYNSSNSEAKYYRNYDAHVNSTSPTGSWDTNNEYIIGDRPNFGSATEIDGNIDEVKFFNKTLTSTQVSSLYNYGTVKVSNFSITAQDAFSGASINNFTATITSNTAGYNRTWNTTNGTITTDILSNSSFLYNITVSADNYFNRTRTNYNVSNNLVAQLAQARATFDAYEKVSGNEVFNFNITINGTTYNSTETFALSAGTYNATFSKDGYYDKTREITVVAEEVQLYNFTDVYNHRANFTIDVLSGSATDQNFTIDIYSDDHDFSEKLLTTSGNILANLTHGNYTVWLNDSYHALQNYSVELNSSTNLTQVTLDSYTTNTISIRFLDEETNNLINDRNITAYFTGSIISYNRTTSNGTMVLDMINPQEYEITYNADGYSQRKYTFTLTNRTFNELDLYLINETQDELILTSVQDSFLDPVPNAVIRAQKKNLSGTNYYTVETCTTDNNGECLLHLVLYDTTYRFLIDVDGNTVLTSADQTIKQSTLSFRVNLEQDTLEEINNILRITGSLFYDKANSNIEFTWNDQNSLGVTACLDIDTRQGATTSDYNLSCTTSASGTIILPIDTNLSVTYEATGYVLVDGQRYELDRLSVAGNTFGQGMGINALFIFGFIIVGIAAFTGLWNPVVGPITTAAVIWFFNYIGFITVGTAAVTSLIIGAIMVAYLSKS